MSAERQVVFRVGSSRVRVTEEDAALLLADLQMYGNAYVRPTGRVGGYGARLYARVDPRTVAA